MRNDSQPKLGHINLVMYSGIYIKKNYNLYNKNAKINK